MTPSLTSTGSPLLTLKGEKPKRTKPRKAVRSFSIRLGKWQVILQIWKYRKTIKP
jgi:ribosomal protein L5